MQLHHQEDIWLHVIDFLGNGQFPLISHLRLVNHQWFLLVNQSVRRLTLTQQFCHETSILLPVNYKQKERIAQLFHFLKQFTHVQVIQIYGFDHDIQMVHLSQLGRSYCSLLERFEMNDNEINYCNNHLHLKQFLKGFPHYKTLDLNAPLVRRNFRLSFNPQRCAKYIAKYGRNLEELYLCYSMEPLDFTDICNHCTKLNKVYIRASGSFRPFDLSGLKFIKSLSLYGENFSREGIERFIENNVRNLESLALFVPDDLMDSILDGFAHTDHSISELILTASSPTAEVRKLVPFITSNIANFQVLRVSHFHPSPIDTILVETLSKCPRFTTLESNI